jgi:hypothetical protein
MTCVSPLPIIVTNNCDDQLVRRTGAFWFVVLEAPVPVSCHHWFRTCSCTVGSGAHMLWSKADYLMGRPWKWLEKARSGVPTVPLEGTAPLTRRILTKLHLLKSLPPPNMAKLGTKPLTCQPLRDISHQTIALLELQSPWIQRTENDDKRLRMQTTCSVISAKELWVAWTGAMAHIYNASYMEIRKIKVQAQPGQKVNKTPSQPTSWVW